MDEPEAQVNTDLENVDADTLRILTRAGTGLCVHTGQLELSGKRLERRAGVSTAGA